MKISRTFRALFLLAGLAAATACNTPTTPGPTLSSLSVTEWAQGSTVNVLMTGSLLAGATPVFTPATGLTVTSLQATDTAISATVAVASTAQTGQRQVVATAGNKSSNPLTFTIGGGNRPPTINAMSITPTFGIAFLTAFNYSASASDLDGDPVSYNWNIAGNTFNGPGGAITFTTGGNGSAILTVNDGRGGTASQTRTFTVGSMTGTWDGTNNILGSFVMTLPQTGGSISGTYSDTSPFGPGRTDPAQPGTISPSGTIEIRMKQGGFTDFTFRGTMSTTGRLITGGIFGSGFTGHPFTMNKR